MVRYRLEIYGIVQGVGFRPFVYRLACTLNLSGFVQNTAGGVSTEIEGETDDCLSFINALRKQAPPLSKISDITINEIATRDDGAFCIIPSVGGAHNALISPDIAVCAECKNDISDNMNRRYCYPFTNCTNCGPRFSIISDIPYDRKSTSMAAFKMCPDCASEYGDPNSRRFHAQPDACPVCGPRLRLLTRDGELTGDPIDRFKTLIKDGKIVAVKGLGGYHLACDALNNDAVRLLRHRKSRYEKPFAVMVRDLAAARTLCDISGGEEKLLLSSQAPIVLLRKKEGCPAEEEVAPGNKRLGLMLPYTPLHCLLTENCPVLVMTSANISDSPMLYKGDDEEKLFSLADAVLTHNRDIVRRVDDSVAVITGGVTRLLRRSRGYAPSPVFLAGNSKTILALGGQQNNTFCLLKGENAFLSGYIGDLDEPTVCRDFRNEVDSFIRLFDAQPEIVVRDCHPDYFTSVYADTLQGTVPVFLTQHHRAHFASVLAENDIRYDTIGFIFDGTGYGDDGTVWGGELLYGGRKNIERFGHLRTFPLLGGEAAVREPWRCALSVISACAGDKTAVSYFSDRQKEAALLLTAGEKGINAPLTSSIGRLFDAVAAIAGVRSETTYEGQAAIELEQALDSDAEGAYHFDIHEENGTLVFDWRGLINEVLTDVAKKTTPGVISARFHRAIVHMMCDAAQRIRQKTGCATVALSGGCFQNEYLLEEGIKTLKKYGFDVFTNTLVPSGDGGISLGQAALASWSAE